MFHRLKHFYQRMIGFFQPIDPPEGLRVTKAYIPACALLDHEQLITHTAYGDTPVVLAEDVCLSWSMTVNSTQVSRIQLRIGTYGRHNSCHLHLHINARHTRLHLAACADNEYTQLLLEPPLSCLPGDVLHLRATSPDARLAENRCVALWCAAQPPPFVSKHPPTPLHFALDHPPKFSILMPAVDQSSTAFSKLWASLRSVLESDPHADKEVLLYGASHLDTPHLSGAVYGVATMEHAVQQAQGEFVLWLTQPALLSEPTLEALLATLLSAPQTALVMPKVIDTQGRLCSAGGQVLADARYWLYAAESDATHPEFNQARQINAVQPPCVLSPRHWFRQLWSASDKQQAVPHPADVMLSLSLQALRQGVSARYCPTACVVVDEWSATVSDTQRQACLQDDASIFRHLPDPLEAMPASPHLHCPETEAPLLSIVIPVFNQVDYTWHCLHSLLQCDPAVSREIIVVDNASSDATPTLLAGLKGAFRVIRNTENLGFVDACHQGAADSRGRYLLLLNNDTQLRPGALQALVDVLETQADVGIVGAKLLYPDGRLQEAGCELFADASARNIGRAGDTHAEFAQQDRDVDYCSGAALLIRRTLWQTLGGFDRRYAPAYYEDTDLCLQARQAGFRVRYCHRAEVIHYEGVTAGVDIHSGFKAYQARNQQRFYAKWSSVLQSYS